MAVRRELVIDECGGASRRPRHGHASSNCPSKTPKNLTAEIKPTKHAAADRAFCADPLAKSPCSSAARRFVLYFPLPPLFSFSERLLLHGSSRKSTAAKSSLKIYTNVRLCFHEGFHCHYPFRPLQGRLTPSECNDFGFVPLTCAN